MSVSGDFNLHVRLLRQRNRHIRLTRGSVSLLVVAVACWLAGFGFALHLGLSLLAGLAGLFWPVQGSRAWAFGYITQQSGLAYETALVIEQQPRDEHGFRSSVRSRARASIAGMDQPKFSEWWLAALILSVAIILLPALQLSAPWSGSPAAPPPSSPLTTVPDAPGDESDEEEPAAEEEAQPELEEEELAAPQVEQASGDSQEPATAASAETPGTEREGDVLDRFLDNLRERPRAPEPAPEIPGSPMPADAEESERGDDEEDSDSSAPFDENAEDPAESDSEGQTGADGAADQQEGDQQEDLDDEGSEQPGDQGEPAGDGEQPGDAPAPTDEQDPDGAQGLTEGDEEGDGAGGGPGVESPAADEERLPAPGEEEFLEGQLQGNEVNIGGDVRLPGFSDVELPPDASPARLGEAVERSLTGGNVPLEYQDIIRNYFR